MIFIQFQVLISFATTFGFLGPFHLVLASLRQPPVHICRYIKQVNPDFLTALSIPQTQSNNPSQYCLMTFLGDSNDCIG